MLGRISVANVFDASSDAAAHKIVKMVCRFIFFYFPTFRSHGFAARGSYKGRASFSGRESMTF